MDQWAPEQVDAHVWFMHDFGAGLEETRVCSRSCCCTMHGARHGPAPTAGSCPLPSGGDPATAARSTPKPPDQRPASPNATTSRDSPDPPDGG